MVTKPDAVLDELVEQLGVLSRKWEETFAYSPEVDPKAYARLQKLINTYGYETVRCAFEIALRMGDKAIPKARSALPLAVALCQVCRADHA